MTGFSTGAADAEVNRFDAFLGAELLTEAIDGGLESGLGGDLDAALKAWEYAASVEADGRAAEVVNPSTARFRVADLVMAGVSAFPMRVKCATLAWHTFKSALEGGEAAKTE